ncbi:hypothetical protein [Yeosuana sp. AK3]
MKKYHLFPILLLVQFTVNSQHLIINDTIYKEGIYKTFEEFKYNKPSIRFNYNIITENNGYDISNNENQVSFYKVLINKKEGKSIGTVFGFCDGKNVYINDGLPKLSPETEFYKIEYFGKFSYYQYVKKQKTKKLISRAERNIDNTRNIRISNNVRRMLEASTTVDEVSLVEKIINIHTGETIILNTKTLQKLISDNKKLLDEFNKEPQQNKKLKQFLIKYLEDTEQITN